jgi:hypothetical protein
MPTEDEVKQVKRKYSADLLKEPGVCGVGVEKNENGEYILAVHLDSAVPNAGTTIPDSLDGSPIRKDFGGPFTKFG